jgi:D-alanine-D-alanine ligase
VAKKTIAVIFGSRSPEHEVSVITALQVMQNLDKDKYSVLPIYISKTGQWFAGDESLLKPETYKNLDALTKLSPVICDLSKLEIKKLTNPLPIANSQLNIDVVFPVFHGSFGEDGTIQGMLEMLNYPYTGCGVMASSLGMDKVLQKQVFASIGIPQVKHLWFNRTDWQANPDQVLSQLKSLKSPLYVKPVNGGSSIGITKVKKVSDLKDAIDVACHYDRKILVEESAEGFKEINISVLGNSGSPLRTSICEQPVASTEVLSFSDKYESGNSKTSGMASAQRLIPAPIKETTATKIQELAKLAYTALDCSGLSRIDFLVSKDEKTIYINEINTIPGSLAFYLWDKSGLSFPALLDELINLAESRHQDRQQSTFTFSNNLLANLSSTLGGSKNATT